MDLSASSPSNTHTAALLSGTIWFKLTVIPEESLETYGRRRCSTGFHLLPLHRCHLLGQLLVVEKGWGVRGRAERDSAVLQLWEFNGFEGAPEVHELALLYGTKSASCMQNTCKILHKSKVTLLLFHQSHLQNGFGYFSPAYYLFCPLN